MKGNGWSGAGAVPWVDHEHQAWENQPATEGVPTDFDFLVNHKIFKWDFLRIEYTAASRLAYLKHNKT